MNRLAIVALFLSLGVALGMTLAFITPESDARQTIEWLDNPRSLEDFRLEAETGEFDKQSLMGHWTIVLFGFLHCPDICPTSLSQLAALADSLAAISTGKEVAYIFVSVDSARDSVTEVSRYARHFDPSIRGVTGTEEQLAQFSSGLGVQFKVSADSDDYEVAHSITFSLIDPEGVFRGRFRPGFDVPDVVSSLASKITEASI